MRNHYVPRPDRYLDVFAKTPKGARPERALPVQTPRTGTSYGVLTRPVVRVEGTKKLSHTLGFKDERTANGKGRPKGAVGAEVWVAVCREGEARPRPGEAYRLVGVNSKGSLAMEFAAGDAGSTAHYLLRWVTGGGEHGPWSEVMSVGIAA